MAAIKSAGMAPEKIVRSLVHRLGYRFRLHGKNLPGKPDLVFPSRKKVIFVHGCFWHQHPGKRCRIVRKPKSNLGYWGPKLIGNMARDKRNISMLAKMGWGSLVIWECETDNTEKMQERIVKFLGARISRGAVMPAKTHRRERKG